MSAQHLRPGRHTIYLPTIDVRSVPICPIAQLPRRPRLPSVDDWICESHAAAWFLLEHCPDALDFRAPQFPTIVTTDFLIRTPALPFRNPQLRVPCDSLSEYPFWQVENNAGHLNIQRDSLLSLHVRAPTLQWSGMLVRVIDPIAISTDYVIFFVALSTKRTGLLLCPRAATSIPIPDPTTLPIPDPTTLPNPDPTTLRTPDLACRSPMTLPPQYTLVTPHREPSAESMLEEPRAANGTCSRRGHRFIARPIAENVSGVSSMTQRNTTGV